jgi:outer membrane protein TolC
MKKCRPFWIGILFLLIPFLLQSSEQKEFSLLEIIDLALDNNPLLSAKKSDVEARKASYEASKRLANPELALNLGKATAYDEDRERNTGGIALSQFVENPFKRHHRIQIYEKDWEAAQYNQSALILVSSQ